MVIKGKEIPKKLIERFWQRVAIGEVDECWIWQGGLNSKKKGYDYGCFWVGPVGESMLAHRLALSFHLGKDVGPKEAMHSCDIPRCCNPFHLSPASHLQNMRDMYKKGRRICEKGTDRYNAKLTDEKVKDIRRLCKEHRDLTEQITALRNSINSLYVKLQETKRRHKSTTKFALGLRYGVDGAVIQLIEQRKSWKHVKD